MNVRKDGYCAIKASAVPAQILASATGTARRRPAAAAAAVKGEHSRANAQTLAVAAPHKGEGQPVSGGSNKSLHKDRSEFCETRPPERRRGQRELGGERKSPAEQNNQGSRRREDSPPPG